MKLGLFCKVNWDKNTELAKMAIGLKFRRNKICKIPDMNTAYIARHKGKRGLRFVCVCDKDQEWLRTNKQEYVKISVRKVKREVKAFRSYLEDMGRIKN